MPAAKYAGSPGGSGNPPGKYSSGYLSSKSDGGHFITDGDYRGSMHIDIPTSSKVVGNQPKASSSADLGLRTKAI